MDIDEYEEETTFSKETVDNLLQQSLLNQSNLPSTSTEIAVAAAPPVVIHNEIENNLDIFYNCSMSLRSHNSIYDYNDKIVKIEAVTKTLKALQILVWINSWEIFNINFAPHIISEYRFQPKITRPEVLEQIKYVFENHAMANNTPENESLRKVMQTIFSIFSSTVSTDSTILGTSMITERKTIDLNSIADLSNALTIINDTLLKMLTFNINKLNEPHDGEKLDMDLWENTPLTTTEFIAMYVFQLTLIINSNFENVNFGNTQITHIFGMLIIDVLTDRLSRELWIPKRTSLSRTIMNDFYKFCPTFRTFTYNKYTEGTSNQQYYDQVNKFIGENERFKIFNLEAFLFSANFDEKNRVAFILEQLFLKLEQKDMATKTIEKFSAYIENMKSSNVNYQIYNESVIMVFFEIDGFIAMLQKQSNNLNIDIPFDNISGTKW